MAEDSYAHECMRAELLGIQPPDQAEFERARSARLEQQQAEQEAAEAVMLEQQDESLRGAGGKLDELNSILSSTQQKLNRFKQTACGSLTNIFNRNSSTDVPPAEQAAPSAKVEPATEPITAEFAVEQPAETGSVSGVVPAIPTEKIRAAKAESAKKMNTQLDKLDALINKADNAQLAMSEQNKQMRRMAK